MSFQLVFLGRFLDPDFEYDAKMYNSDLCVWIVLRRSFSVLFYSTLHVGSFLSKTIAALCDASAEANLDAYFQALRRFFELFSTFWYFCAALSMLRLSFSLFFVYIIYQ